MDECERRFEPVSPVQTIRRLEVIATRPTRSADEAVGVVVDTASVLGMESTPGKDNGQRANLMFGPEPGKGGSFVVARTARPPANPRPPAQSVVDHVCYTIPNWEDGRVNAALKASGRPFTSRSGNVNVLDPFNYPVQLANSEEENPWK